MTRACIFVYQRDDASCICLRKWYAFSFVRLSACSFVRSFVRPLVCSFVAFFISLQPHFGLFVMQLPLSRSLADDKTGKNCPSFKEKGKKKVIDRWNCCLKMALADSFSQRPIPSTSSIPRPQITDHPVYVQMRRCPGVDDDQAWRATIVYLDLFESKQ